MFEVGFSELLLISVLALIVLGPERLPKVAAEVGRWMGRARSMARQFREQLEEEVDLDKFASSGSSKSSSASNNSSQSSAAAAAASSATAAATTSDDPDTRHNDYPGALPDNDPAPGDDTASTTSAMGTASEAPAVAAQAGDEQHPRT